MSQVINFIKLDFNRSNDITIPTIELDQGSRFVRVQLQNNNQSVDITGSQVAITVIRNDLEEIIESCNILNAKEGLIEFEISKSMVARQGDILCQLKLSDNDSLLSSQLFKISVNNTLTLSLEESRSEMDVLIHALGEVQNIDNRFAQTNAQLSETIQNLGYVTYEMFGAIGDGVTNDIDAIRKAHQYANSNGINVKCQSNKKYRVVITDSYIDINTSVDFNNSTIIVDDSVRNHSSRNYPLFRVNGVLLQHNSLIGKTITKSTTNINELADGKEKIVILNDDNKRIYKRKGVLSDEGKSIKECVVVDGQGNLRNTTLFDYTVTQYEVFEYRKNKIILENCNFEHIENGNGSISEYYRSGIFIVGSSNVVIRNFDLKVTSFESSYPQNGFITIFKSADVLVENCNFEPYIAYESSANNTLMGTYGIRTDISNNVILKNVICNDFNNTTKWGIHTSNFMNHLTFENCVLNRIDAHEGMFNVTVKDTKIGVYGINAIGGGELTLINCDIYTPKFIVNLREDYGADWEGSINFNNCTWHPRTKAKDMISMVKCANDHTYDFGKLCYYPNINIKDLHIDESAMDVTMIYVVGNFDSGNGNPFGATSVSPYRAPKKINIDGISGYPIVLFRDFPVKKFYAEEPLYVNIRNVDFVNVYHNRKFWSGGYNDVTLGSIAQSSYTTDIDDRTLPNRCICYYNINNCTNLDINLNACADTMRVSQSHVTRLYTKNVNCYSKVNLVDCAYHLVVWIDNTDYQQIGDVDNIYLNNCRVYKPIMLNGIATPNIERMNNLYRGIFYNEPTRGRAMCKVSVHNTWVEFGDELVGIKKLNEYDQCAGWSGNVLNALAWKPFTRFKGLVAERPIPDDVSYPLGIVPKVQDGFIYYNTDINTSSMYHNGVWETIKYANTL